jgi:hypothetical protein
MMFKKKRRKQLLALPVAAYYINWFSVHSTSTSLDQKKNYITDALFVII